MGQSETPGKGGKQRAEAAQEQQDKKPAAGGKKAGGGCGCLLVGALVLAVAVGGFNSCSGGSSSDSNVDEQVRQDEAKDNCHDWVKESLKSPSSAKFSGDVVTGDRSGYTVVGDVDADNSFGASLRSGWMCSIRLDGDTWRGNASLLQDQSG